MPTRRNLRAAHALLAGLIAVSGSAGAAIFTVGTGAGCTHGTIQSAINAAEANPGADTIRLTRSLTYQPEANSIVTSQHLNVVGGFATCTQAATDNIKTTVSGLGGAAAPVFRIVTGTGAIIKLRHLTVTLGDVAGAGYGGGILFSGDGVLEIIESNITNNTAGYGGGIYAQATGSNAELVISASTQISGNTARYNGGGLYLAGPLEMTMAAPSSIIAFNQALGEDGFGGYGGGMHVIGPARAYIGTSGLGGLGAFYSNSAVDGGGISIVSGGGDGVDAWVYLYTVNPQQPIMLRGNDASDTGGAIYLQGYVSLFDESRANLCAMDFRIEDNYARDGSAIYQNSDSFIIDVSGLVRLNDPSCARPGAVRCASGVPCNTISANDTAPDTGPGSGATLRLLGGARLIGNRFEMRDNRGGYAIRGTTGTSNMDISDCLIANNEMTRQLITMGGDSKIDGCTIAQNLIGSMDVIQSGFSQTLRHSIIDQPGHLTLAHSGSPTNVDILYVLSNDITSLPFSPAILVGAPEFVDAAAGNFRLQLSSPAVDFAPPIIGGGPDLDLDGLERDVEIPCVPNYYGVRDLGAYELQNGASVCGGVPEIFADGFED